LGFMLFLWKQLQFPSTICNILQEISVDLLPESSLGGCIIILVLQFIFFCSFFSRQCKESFRKSLFVASDFWLISSQIMFPHSFACILTALHYPKESVYCARIILK